jgi:hypothetical protein
MCLTELMSRVFSGPWYILMDLYDGPGYEIIVVVSSSGEV